MQEANKTTQSQYGRPISTGDMIYSVPHGAIGRGNQFKDAGVGVMLT